MITDTMILHNKRIVITRSSVIKVNWGSKKVDWIVLFDGLGNHWDWSKRELAETQLSRRTVDQIRDVTIPQDVNDIEIGDTAELFDTNGKSLWKFEIISGLDKDPLITWYVKNTYFRVVNLEHG